MDNEGELLLLDREGGVCKVRLLSPLFLSCFVLSRCRIIRSCVVNPNIPNHSHTSFILRAACSTSSVRRGGRGAKDRGHSPIEK